MSLKDRISNIINGEIKFEDIDKEYGSYLKADKLKECRELTNGRFSPLAWWFVLDIIRSPENKSINDVIKAAEHNAIEIWEDSAKSGLASIGLESAKDIQELLAIAEEHGLIKTDGEPDPLIVTLFGE